MRKTKDLKKLGAPQWEGNTLPLWGVWTPGIFDRYRGFVSSPGPPHLFIGGGRIKDKKTLTKNGFGVSKSIFGLNLKANTQVIKFFFILHENKLPHNGGVTARGRGPIIPEPRDLHGGKITFFNFFPKPGFLIIFPGPPDFSPNKTWGKNKVWGINRCT